MERTAKTLWNRCLGLLPSRWLTASGRCMAWMGFAGTAPIFLAGCDARGVNRPEGGEIRVVFDEALAVAETRVSGIVEDPALTNGLRDLSMWEYSATAWCRNTDCTEIELRIERPRIATADSNNIVIELHDADSAAMSADAILIQATDSMVYNQCERTPYEYDFCERTLAATDGEIGFAAFVPPIGEGSAISGVFEFETEAGRVEGSFVIIGVAAEADYTVYTPPGE